MGALSGDEIADELRDIEQERDRLKEDILAVTGRCDRLAAEVARLREALQRILPFCAEDGVIIRIVKVALAEREGGERG